MNKKKKIEKKILFPPKIDRNKIEPEKRGQKLFIILGMGLPSIKPKNGPKYFF